MIAALPIMYVSEEISRVTSANTVEPWPNVPSVRRKSRDTSCGIVATAMTRMYWLLSRRYSANAASTSSETDRARRRTSVIEESGSQWGSGPYESRAIGGSRRNKNGSGPDVRLGWPESANRCSCVHSRVLLDD